MAVHEILCYSNHIFYGPNKQNVVIFQANIFVGGPLKATTQQFEGRPSYVMWSFWDMLHSTKSTKVS